MYKKIDKFIDYLVYNSTSAKPLWNIELIKSGKLNKWNYVDGCMMTALLDLAKVKQDKSYSDFAIKFLDYYVSIDGNILGYDKQSYNLDNINEGRTLFDAYDLTGNSKYLKAIELLNCQLVDQPRTITGNYWHKLIYPNQIWLDGLYMAQVFKMRYAVAHSKDYSDILSQFQSARNLMYNADKGLYYHGCDCSKEAFWADKNGLSSNFWLRSIGWHLIALVDCIDYCDNDSVKGKLSQMLVEALVGVLRYKDDKTNMFLQVVDCGGKEGNYLETSGSCMVAYALLKAARLGIVDSSFANIGKQVFDGVCDKYLTFDNGKFNLGGICLVAGLGPNDNRRRDGSYKYYISEPIVSNDAKGVAPFALAYAEIKRLSKKDG